MEKSPDPPPINVYRIPPEATAPAAWPFQRADVHFDLVEKRFKMPSKWTCALFRPRYFGFKKFWDFDGTTIYAIFFVVNNPFGVDFPTPLSP